MTSKQSQLNDSVKSTVKLLHLSDLEIAVGKKNLQQTTMEELCKVFPGKISMSRNSLDRGYDFWVTT